MVKHFDHVTVVVRDVERAKAYFDLEAEVERLRAHGVRTHNAITDFHRRKLVFLEGPEGITVELSQWQQP